MNALLESLAAHFSTAQQWLFEGAVQPVLFALGLANLLEDGFDATGWLLVGLLQLVVLVCCIGPLQRWRPVEAVMDRATIRVDMLYTAIHRLGLFRMVLFFALTPGFDALFGALRVAGWQTFHLDALVPGVTDQPLASLVLYLVALDLLNYAVHRAQHQFEWWWRLHSLHHAQRQMTMWSDNRNHLVDDVLRDVLLVVTAQLIGIAPGQFVAVVAITQLSENFSHANLRLWFGRVGERLWVSPRFHRMHHAVGIGHESADRQALGGVNFGVLLPWWDMLFGTANFELRFEPTGVRDQVEQGRDYGRGFWRQQWMGLKRLVGRDLR
jgi:sterol desaturase/sphingolipid hydroxylase (fatty acid hydroxylase superfamily)